MIYCRKDFPQSHRCRTFAPANYGVGKGGEGARVTICREINVEGSYCFGLAN